ncbi:HIT family protein [Azotosporobacter soli]|uniref:HIT family protein n=1 Tax=Azotosporobacter soli TaxID=3055040 RepID=UPI0031FEEFFE
MCLTCQLLRGEKEIPFGVVYENEFVFVHHCIDVAVPGYLILSPKRHVGGYEELTLEESAAVGAALQEMIFRLKRIAGVEKVYIANFAEETAHFHFHLFPRYGWMKEIQAAYVGDKLDGAKLFSLVRQTHKRSGIAEEANVRNVVAAIRKMQMYEEKESL